MSLQLPPDLRYLILFSIPPEKLFDWIFPDVWDHSFVARYLHYHTGEPMFLIRQDLDELPSISDVETYGGTLLIIHDILTEWAKYALNRSTYTHLVCQYGDEELMASITQLDVFDLYHLCVRGYEPTLLLERVAPELLGVETIFTVDRQKEKELILNADNFFAPLVCIYLKDHPDDANFVERVILTPHRDLGIICYNYATERSDPTMMVEFPDLVVDHLFDLFSAIIYLQYVTALDHYIKLAHELHTLDSLVKAFLSAINETGYYDMLREIIKFKYQQTIVDTFEFDPYILHVLADFDPQVEDNIVSFSTGWQFRNPRRVLNF